MRSKTRTADRNQYFSFDSYKEAIDILDKYTTLVLFSFAEHSSEVRDVIVRNFIARAIVSLKGILKLWEVSDYQDCWVLHRCILDRLFHLRTLAKDNTFELFEKWSFKQQYDFKSKYRSDPDFKGKLNPDFFKDTKEQKEKYLAITKERPRWRRPKGETVAKEMGMAFLYKYGYDYASTLVHPMANDGQEDFLRQTNLLRRGLFIDQRVVIHNSCLVVVLIIREGLNSSSLIWRSLIYDFLDNFFSFLKSGSNEYLLSFLKIGKLGPDIDLCKKNSKN